MPSQAPSSLVVRFSLGLHHPHSDKLQSVALPREMVRVVKATWLSITLYWPLQRLLELTAGSVDDWKISFKNGRKKLYIYICHEYHEFQSSIFGLGPESSVKKRKKKMFKLFLNAKIFLHSNQVELEVELLCSGVFFG